MKLIRLLDDIATELEHQVGKIRDYATAASEVEDSAEEHANAVHIRLVGLSMMARHLAKQLEARR
jgi:hypothetical protein